MLGSSIGLDSRWYVDFNGRPATPCNRYWAFPINILKELELQPQHRLAPRLLHACGVVKVFMYK